MHDQPQLSPPAPLSAAVEPGAAVAPAAHTWALPLRQTTLQWAMGAFCATVGGLMLIVPHQFSSPSFALLRAVLPWAGVCYLLAGMATIAVAALAPRRHFVLAAHLACGAVLLLHSYLLMSTGTLTGWPPYLVLGLGTLVAGLLPRRRLAGPAGDLLLVLLGLCAVANGLVVLLVPGQFQLSIYDAVRPLLRWFGLAYLVGGPLLIFAQLRPGWPAALRWACHALVAVPFLAYMALVSLPNRGLTGLVFYGGSGLLLLTLPWLERSFRGSDSSSLHVRLGLTLAGAAALPLILTMALVTGWQESAALQQLLGNQRALALAIADRTADYIQLHQRATSSLAAQPGLLALPPAEQRERLRAFNALYPEFYNCSTYRRDGWAFARSDDFAPRNGLSLSAFRRVLAGASPAVTIRVSRLKKVPVLAFGSPVMDRGVVAGAVVCSLKATGLAEALGRNGPAEARQVYVVDELGRVVAHSDSERVPPLTDFSGLPPVQALLGQQGAQGALTYGRTPGSWSASYAAVSGLGWGVVVELPLALALADVHAARELAFVVLLVVVGAGFVIGFAIARYLTGPLDTLAAAAGQLARGDASAPLPEEGAREVVRLSAAFGQMRADMASAAAAREQAIRQREDFFSVAAHELKTPLTALLGQAQLFQRRAAREKGLGERDRRSLDVIVAQAGRLNTLVSDLLDVSRMQQGQLALSLAPLDLVALIARVVEETRPTLEQHQLALNASSPAIFIAGDELRLEQVLQNLITNAIKYSPDGGPVTVSVGIAGEEAFVAVSDRGLGIPAAAIPHLFQRFYRAGNADPRQISGLGVGLYVVREIVTRHNGRVEVASAPGSGSTFTIWLPLLREAARRDGFG